MSDALRAQLEAVRAGALAIAASAEAILAALPPAGAPGPALAASALPCPHPAASRLTASRMGAPRAWTCVACGVQGDGTVDDLLAAAGDGG